MNMEAKELAIRAIGDKGYQRLIEAGLSVDYVQKQYTGYTRYYAVDKKIIGKVVVLDEEQDTFPVTDYDENGYEIIFASGKGFVWTEWIGVQNCGHYEVIG